MKLICLCKVNVKTTFELYTVTLESFEFKKKATECSQSRMGFFYS